YGMPYLNGVVVAAADYPLAIAAIGYALNEHDVSFEGQNFLAGGDIPDLEGVVVGPPPAAHHIRAGGNDPFAIGAVGKTLDLGRHSESQDCLGGDGIPDPESTVLALADDLPAIGAICQRPETLQG